MDEIYQMLIDCWWICPCRWLSLSSFGQFNHEFHFHPCGPYGKKFQVINMCLFLYLHITISSLRFIFIHVITFHAYGKLHMFGWFHAFFLQVIKFCMYGECEGSFMTEHNSMITSTVLLCWQFHLVLSLIQEDS